MLYRHRRFNGGEQGAGSQVRALPRQLLRKVYDANVLAMGEKVVGAGYALEIAEVFLKTEFEGGRHQRRVDKISAIEKKYCK